MPVLAFRLAPLSLLVDLRQLLGWAISPSAMTASGSARSYAGATSRMISDW
jgi:hypothetical protein